MTDPLSSLEKFGVLGRKFLHDTSNDFTAVGLNLHFIEKLIEPDHPAYKDFHNLTTALKNLQQNTRCLMNWRRQLADPLTTVPAVDFPSLIPPRDGWTVRSTIERTPLKNVRVCSPWILSLFNFLVRGEQGSILLSLIESPNDQCMTPEQVNVTIQASAPFNYDQLPEIEWSIHRELAKLMGGGISVNKNSAPSLFLPAYAA